LERKQLWDEFKIVFVSMKLISIYGERRCRLKSVFHLSYYTLFQKFKAAKALLVISAVLHRKNVNRVVSCCHFSQGHSRATRLFAAMPSRENKTQVFSSGIKNNKVKPDIFCQDSWTVARGIFRVEFCLDGNSVCRYFRFGFWKITVRCISV